ncbi:MAG: hypothetical protein ACLSHO_11015 [Dysosmobacter sp.]
MTMRRNWHRSLPAASEAAGEAKVVFSGDELSDAPEGVFPVALCPPNTARMGIHAIFFGLSGNPVRPRFLPTPDRKPHR